MKLKKIHRCAKAELQHAYKKHGRKRWGRHEFYGILLEEMDELWSDVKADARQANINKEIHQIICVCYRYLNTGDRYRDRYK